MTIEQINYAVEVMKAAANGATIESTVHNSEDWTIAETPCWNWQRFRYRIKPTPKYRPFKNRKELYDAIMLHGTIIVGMTGNYINILEFSDIGIWCSSSTNIKKYDICLNEYEYKFADGTPFGVLE